MSLLEEYAASSGLTRRPLPGPSLPGVRAAEDFYLQVPPARQLRIVAEGGAGNPLIGFLSYAEHELNRLLALPEGWDGRRARAISETSVEMAVRVVAAMLDEASPFPQFFPLPDGGLQAEWHMAANDIEIEIDVRGEAHVLAIDDQGRAVVEGRITPGDPACEATAAFLRGLSSLLTRR